MLVTIIVIEQTSGTGITEHFLDVLREGYIILYDVLQGNYTVVEATGSRAYIGIETYI